MKLVIASQNQGKFREIKKSLEPFSITLITQNEASPPEIGLSFVENALIKARFAAEQTGLPALADDSGLEVTALNGAPGIYSARYAGTQATDTENIQKLLTDLKKSGSTNRFARFYCALVLMKYPNDPTPLICEGSWEGLILEQPSGTQGFGYDPIFYDPEYQCCAAEMPLDLKNQISHRGKALKLFIQKLENYACTFGQKSEKDIPQWLNCFKRY